MNKRTNKIDMIQVMSNPKYRGKHLIVIAGRVLTARTGKEANEMLDKLEKRYPRETAAITYIPKADTILYCQNTFQSD